MAQADLIAPPTLRMAVAKPKFGIYYALLIIALCAMLAACLTLYIEINRFGGFGTVKGKVASFERPTDLFHHRGHGVHREKLQQIASVHSVVNS
jgi:hypothetical protein